MRLLDWVFAARPLLILPVWTIFLVSLHYHHQLAGQRFSFEDLLVLLGLTLMTAGAMYLNQVFDAESDAINRKVGFLQRGFLTERQLMAGFLVCSVLSLALAAFISIVTVAIFLQAFVLAWMYSAPPARLKDRPILGLLANAYSFGFLVSMAVMPEINVDNAGLLGWDTPFYFFLVVGSVHCLTTVLDIEGDRKTGKRTIGAVLGHRGAAVVALLLLAIAMLVAYESEYYFLLVLAALSFLLFLLNIFLPSLKTAQLAIKPPIVFLSLMAGYFYPFFLVFIIVLLWLTRVYYHRRFNMAYPSLI